MAYASCAMINAQINFAQIEKEMLVIVFWCEKFNVYTYEADINLLRVFLKSFSTKFLRVYKKVRLRWQKYHVKVKYVPGKVLYIAYTLSRVFHQSSVPDDNDISEDMENLIHSVIINLPISDVKLIELQKLNKNDPIVQMLN